MAIELKQSLKLGQHLVITPQLQQAIKLLQLSRMELSTMIQKELVENPILEELGEGPSDEDIAAETAEKSQGEITEQAKEEDKGHSHEMEPVGNADGELKEPADFDWENYLGNYTSPLPSAPAANFDDLPSFESTLTKSESLQEHLLWQLHLSNYNSDEVVIGSEIIGNINDDGYFAATIEEVAAQLKIAPERVESVLKRIQGMDPVGVGARDLQECMMLQTRHLGADGELIQEIIANHLHDLERHNYVHIAKKLKQPADHIRELAQIIHSLEPKPGRPFTEENTHYITPDVYVYKVADGYEVVLNEDGLPKLQVSNFYKRTLMQKNHNGSDGQTKDYIQDKLRSALWLIKSIHQRQQTLYKVTKSIFKFQHDFLEKGVGALKPMILRDVAEDIEMHESTVSRVTTNKYVHTPRGIFELKYFFNSSIQQVEGRDIAAEAVKSKIKQLIDTEDPKKPLSDQDLVATLKTQNIAIARRTVAKYREMLNIPSSSHRRRME
ncbi:MAG: RNA polymerase sigma-54 factor [Deltaproteobacteria bacterium CG11_big_fil_rev_8_21_14_0_20_47_16]|nr:MAG: RNA polymerase sigma-54 factor [Deltaproteobacteria bacterium CG11_big_fil_rev_8_21_14_0_20_47_16]